MDWRGQEWKPAAESRWQRGGEAGGWDTQEARRAGHGTGRLWAKEGAVQDRAQGCGGDNNGTETQTGSLGEVDVRKFNTEALKHMLNALEALSDPYTICVCVCVCMYMYI